MSQFPISAESNGFDSFLSGILSRPVTAASVADEAARIGKAEITERYVDACLMTHAEASTETSVSILSPAYA